jgi:anti-sigma B factor antagonist
VNEIFEVKVGNRYGRTVVVGRGELDVASSPAFRDALIAAQADAADVIVDLSELTFIDSSGISTLIRAHQRTSDGGSIKVVGARSAVRRVFDITGVSKLLLLDSQPLTWHQVTYHSGGWRQWITEEKTSDGIPVAEIIELGAHDARPEHSVRYCLEHQGEASLFETLEEAMRTADLLGSIIPEMRE